MHGGVLPAMRDRIAFAIDLNRFGREQAPIAQFAEERQQPALPRQRRPHILLRQLLPRLLQAAPRAQQPVPRAVDSLVQFLRLEQVIAIRSQPRQIRVERSNARKQVGRQYRPLAAHRRKYSMLSSLHLYPLRQIHIHPQHIHRQLRLNTITHAPYLRGGTYAPVRVEQLLAPLMRHLLQVWSQQLELVQHLPQKLFRLFRINITLGRRLQQRLYRLAIADPFGVLRGTRKGQHLAVLGQQLLLPRSMLSGYTKAQAYQQECCAARDATGADDSTAAGGAAFREQRVERHIHYVARQSLDERVGAAEVERSLLHGQLK